MVLFLSRLTGRKRPDTVPGSAEYPYVPPKSSQDEIKRRVFSHTLRTSNCVPTHFNFTTPLGTGDRGRVSGSGSGESRGSGSLRVGDTVVPFGPSTGSLVGICRRPYVSTYCNLIRVSVWVPRVRTKFYIVWSFYYSRRTKVGCGRSYCEEIWK